VAGSIVFMRICDISAQDVFDTGKLNALSDCTDEDWKIIADAVDTAIEHSMK